VETIAGVEERHAGVGRNAAKLPGDIESFGPAVLLHETSQAQMKNFRAILQARLDIIQLRQAIVDHAEFGITAGGLDLPFKLHVKLLSIGLAK
jgi:hypothetical protein